VTVVVVGACAFSPAVPARIGDCTEGLQVNHMHPTSRPRALVSSGLLLLLVAATNAGCAAEQTEEVVAIPGYPEFTLSVSPGVAPGLTAGCDGDEVPTGRLRGRVYYIPPETRLFPNLDTLTPVDTVCLDRLDVTPRRSVYPAFPGLRDRYRWFAVDLQGVFVVQNPDLYYFRLTSDDGSQLYVDRALVVDNDGYHPPRMAMGSATLTAGPHTIRVPYWQGPGPLALILEVARAGDPSYRVLRVDQGL
jgi:hypothetical protein